MQHTMQELGVEVHVEVATDSVAAKGAVMRTGVGMMKHIDLNQMWVQERASKGTIGYRKIPRCQNVADFATHHWTAAEGRIHMINMGVTVEADSDDGAMANVEVIIHKRSGEEDGALYNVGLNASLLSVSSSHVTRCKDPTESTRRLLNSSCLPLGGRDLHVSDGDIRACVNDVLCSQADERSTCSRGCFGVSPIYPIYQTPQWMRRLRGCPSQ